ncbi:MAG: nucleotide sugar dehydrogenase [bacterium]
MEETINNFSQNDTEEDSLLSEKFYRQKNQNPVIDEFSQSRKPAVCVIGMGYVGFPLAVLAASKGYEVFGFDTDTEKLKLIDKGANIAGEKYLDELIPKAKINTFHDPRLMRICDIFIICVPTPVDEKAHPILDYVVSATRAIAQNAKKGALVILESTVNPGVCEGVIGPIFEEAGYKIGQDIFIVHCPERVNPGDATWNVTNLPRVIGSLDDAGLKKAMEFYQSIVDAPIIAMDNIREAEAVKILENSFRDINIAFVNELAKSFDRLDIDITNVIRGAATKPFAFMAHWPGCGVGGHCIPVDPYYLIEEAKKNDFDHKFLRSARNINNSMPVYTVELLQEALNSIEKSIKGTNIGILGVSYKANIGDLRESPPLKIIELLRKKGANLHIFDPYIAKLSTTGSLAELLQKSEAIIVATNHREFLQMPVEEFGNNNIRVIIDGRNCLDKKAIKKLGIVYRGIGR